jgi:hypothetical protein
MFKNFNTKYLLYFILVIIILSIASGIGYFIYYIKFPPLSESNNQNNSQNNLQNNSLAYKISQIAATNRNLASQQQIITDTELLLLQRKNIIDASIRAGQALIASREISRQQEVLRQKKLQEEAALNKRFEFGNTNGQNYDNSEL